MGSDRLLTDRIIDRQIHGLDGSDRFFDTRVYSGHGQVHRLPFIQEREEILIKNRGYRVKQLEFLGSKYKRHELVECICRLQRFDCSSMVIVHPCWYCDVV
ncbi:hypothetical protein TNCV_4679561 [Trichonephila clavipes]|nr:hypothetical protein TNCV_4679561 [Trichonephila clavipes]